MGRPEKPLVLTEKPYLLRLCTVLRAVRSALGVTFAQMGAVATVSEATLKRAASGDAVPKWDTAVAFVFAGETASGRILSADLWYKIQHAWQLARMEERGTLHLRAPRPEYIADYRDLSRSLEALYERSGALPLRTVRAQSRDPLALPVSTLARIVKRETIPVDERQLLAFVHGCGVHDDRPWKEAWSKLQSQSHTPSIELPDSIAHLMMQKREVA